jgi:hypothetical protein
VPPSEAEIEQRLRYDTRYYARNCLTIVNQQEQMVRLEGKPAQLRLEQAMQSQEAEDRPIRIGILKARKEGMSTWTEGKMVHRCTQRPNHKGLVVAHDKDTASEIFEMAEIMYGYLPDEQVGELKLKPDLWAQRRGTELRWGQKSREARMSGDRGLNSSLRVDTAKEVQAGRGFTYHSLHLSEVAFWGDEGRRKLTALLNTVPDEPGTMIVLESTANGYNHWRSLWTKYSKLADWIMLFFAWFEEPEYTRPFLSEEEREEFIESVGEGEYGEDEPDLIERFGCTYEQLHWRRWCIDNRCSGDLRTFHQEYPAEADEAFLAAGSTVFSSSYISKVVDSADVWDEHAEKGTFAPAELVTEKRRRVEIQVPKGALWLPESAVERKPRGWWRVWEQPEEGHEEEQIIDGIPKQVEIPRGQYIVSMDPATGDDNDEGKRAYLAIEVINHRTREQVAEYRSRDDPDEVAMQALLAAFHYHNAWLAVEITGGYGWAIWRKWWIDWRYPFTYFRQPADKRNPEKMLDRGGWSTDSVTRPQMISHMTELMRTGRHGVRSGLLAGEFPTFIRDEKGKVGPEASAFSDLLMAYMIAQRIADEKPLRSERLRRVNEVVERAKTRRGGYVPA